MPATKFEMLAARATRHAEAREWAASRAAWMDALAMRPGSADAMLELSYVESLAGRYREARSWCVRAAEASARIVPAPALIKRLRTFNEGASLRAIAAELLVDDRALPEVLLECATQLSNLNDFELAMRCAEAVVARQPGGVRARVVRAQLYAHEGRVDEAAAEFEWALGRNPRMPTVWWMLARLRRQTPDANHIAPLRSLLAARGLAPGEIAVAARALHKELDDVGDHEGAWRALRLLCDSMRSFLPYDPRETERLVDALMAWKPPQREPAPGRGLAATPVFIVGMHRSGTTLLEQLLAGSPRVRALGELHDFTSAMRYATDRHCRIPIDIDGVDRAREADFDDIGRRYLDGMAWRLGGESHFTDKQPANFLNAGFICRALPGAKILHMVRDPMETCFSNLRELFSDDNRHSYDQRELAAYFLQYRRLMAHWHAMFPGRILDVNYARLTAEPEQAMREVALFCGIDYVQGMRSTRSSRRAVSTASALQVREEVAIRPVAKWTPYAGHLEPLRDALGLRDPVRI